MESTQQWKKEWTIDTATACMNLKLIMLSERSQTKNEYILYDSIYMKF